MPIVKIDPSLYAEIVRKHTVDERKPSDIAQDYGVLEGTIRKILQSKHAYIKRSTRTHSCNENYFNSIYDERRAYFLGLLYADGCNNKRGVVLGLCEPDQYLLQELIKALESPVTIKERHRRKPFHKRKFVCSIWSQKLSRELSAKGCVPAKSLILQFPTPFQVPIDLMSHFLRGYMDGDGCIRYTQGKSKQLYLSFTSSRPFCGGLNAFLLKYFGFDGMFHTYNHSSAMDLKLSTRKAIVLLDYIYSDASIKMHRKFNKFIEFLKIYTPKNVGGTQITTDQMIKLRDKWIIKAELGENPLTHVGLPPYPVATDTRPNYILRTVRQPIAVAAD